MKQYGCETVENVWRKWPMTGILIYFGTQHGPKIGPMRPIIHTPPEVATMSMWKKILMWNQWKSFEKMTNDRNFGPIWGPFNWASEAHIVHISESSYNEHIKQDWYESRGSFTKINEDLRFDLFGGSKWPKNVGLWGLILHTYKKI